MTERRSLLRSLAAAPLAALPFADALAQASGTGGTLRIAMTTADVPLSAGMPNQGSEGMRFLGYPCFEPLVAWDLSRTDRLPTLKPGLATAWSVDAADRTLWTFTLREGVTFHDGTPFDADAVAWTLGRFFDESAPQYDRATAGFVRTRVPTVASWEKRGPHSIAIRTRFPASYFPSQLTWLLISSPAAFERAGRDWAATARAPAGTGPFKLTRLVPRERAELERNDAYWDRSRLPGVARILLIPVPDAAARIAALRSGQVDWIETPPPDAVPGLTAAGFQVVSNTYPHVWPYYFKVTPDSPFADVRVRLAANYAVDRAAVASMFNGTAEPAVGYWPAGSAVFGQPKNRFTYDVARARALLAEAGYAEGRRVTATIMISPSGGGQMLPLPMNELMQQQMAPAGFDLRFEVIEFNAMLTAWRQAPDQGANRGVHAMNQASTTWDHALLWRWFHSRNVTPQGVNWGHYRSPALDAALDALEGDFSGAPLEPALARIHETLVDEAPWLYVVHDRQARAFSRRVAGYLPAQSWFTDLTRITMG